MVSSGTTTNLIKRSLSDIYNKKVELIVSNVGESFIGDRVKDDSGKSSRPISETIKDKKSTEYKRQKLEEKILKYVYYYLGYEYINSLKL